MLWDKVLAAIRFDLAQRSKQDHNLADIGMTASIARDT